MTPFSKKLTVAIVVIMAVLGGRWFTSSQPQTGAKTAQSMPSVGIIQVVEHPALDSTRQGIVDELKDSGYIPGKTMNLLYESAQVNLGLASQIVQKFLGQKVNVIVAIGTIPAQVAAQATQTNPGTPVIFSSVTDPVGAKIVLHPEKPEGNITGVSNYVEAGQHFALFRKVLATLKRLGVIYNPGDDNSVILLGRMKEIAKTMNLEIVPVTASKTSEVVAAAQSLVGKVDAIFVNNDNTALAAFDSIVKVGQDHEIPVFVSDVDCLGKGALAALGPDQYQLGRQTGKMLVKILKGGAQPKDLPVEGPEKVDFKFNFEVARKLGLQNVDALLGSAE
ncbi:MAG: ABC transporter substrate-binding protein [Alphaproteobacteria bacterium]|nr:ABC transporter substrate-binding protein [Alphaproteobacteria bacterium]